MNRQEFLQQLRSHIAPADDYVFINDTIAYYDEYFDTEIRKGKSEDEIIRELGDPRLIAKSILATRGDKADNTSDEYADKQSGRAGKTFSIPGWLLKILMLVLAVVVIVAAFMLLSSIAPILLIGFAVYILYRALKNNSR